MNSESRLRIRTEVWNKFSIFSLIVILFSSFFLSCEKDDICVEGDTPLLIIRFYDMSDTTEVKSVTNLRIIGVGNGGPVDTFTDRSTRDSVALPLRINEVDTEFLLIQNSAGEEGAETGNIDTLRFNYTTEEVFISRACGFIANYNDLTEDLITDSENWIQSITIASQSVDSQLQAHVKVFH